jgi:hypothetical protein
VGLTPDIEVENPGAGRRSGKQSLATDDAR